jgi:hypothetical protein
VTGPNRAMGRKHRNAAAVAASAKNPALASILFT